MVLASTVLKLFNNLALEGGGGGGGFKGPPGLNRINDLTNDCCT